MRTLSIIAAAALVGAIAAPLARADDGQSRVDVEVGKTVEIEVGFMRGLICDDLSVVGADLRGKNEQTNVLVLTGLKEGVTSCRVGQQFPPFHLFEVHVVPPRRR